MSNTIQSLLRLVHSTTTTLLATTTLCALGTGYFVLKCGASAPRKAARCSLDTLPGDVLLEIFTHLDCVQIVRVRRVCRSLCNATKARPVWLRLFDLDALESRRRRIYLDKTLESHSAADLEAAVLKPHKGDFAWTNRDPRIRKIDIDEKHQLLDLLPGGRWCLARAHSESTVVCYDLSDAGRDKAPHFLFAANPLPLLPGTRFRTGPMIDVDIDTTTPYLTFHLAIYFTRSDLDALPDGGIGSHHPILQIWRVTPSFDASGRIDRLIPHHLRTFHRAEHGSFDFLQICGPCIGIREGSQSVVFDWVNTPADVDASLPLSWDEENNFQYAIPSGNLHALLPGCRVLLHSSDKISIGYIPPVVPPSCRDDMPSVPILWTGKIPFELWCRNAGIFGPFFGLDADVFAFTTHPGSPSALLTVPNDFTIADDPHKPRIDSVASLAQPFGLTFYSAWSPRRFAFLHWADRDSKRFLLRRGRVPYPPSPPMVDIPYDDIDVPLEHLAIDEYKYLGDITFDECSSLIGVEVDTSAQASVLLFEPVFH